MKVAVLLALVIVVSGCRVERVTPVRADSARSRASALAGDTAAAGFFRGLRTVRYTANDLAAARDWYRTVLGVEPSFDEPFHVGFDVGGYELGIVPDTGTGGRRPGSGIAYWGVADAAVAWRRLIDLGATAYQPIEDLGGGIRIGAVHDPFGNVLGIVENPGFPIEQ